MGSLVAHMSECLFVPVVCGFGCEDHVLRGEVDRHYSNECCKRPMHCPHCKRCTSWESIADPPSSGAGAGAGAGAGDRSPRGVSKGMSLHFSHCPQFPLLCPQDCGSTLPRCDLNAHLLADYSGASSSCSVPLCRLTLLPCPIEGCDARVRREEIEQHVADPCHIFRLSLLLRQARADLCQARADISKLMSAQRDDPPM